MNCFEFHDKLNLFLSKTVDNAEEAADQRPLSQDEIAAIRIHIAGCADCQRDFEVARKIYQALWERFKSSDLKALWPTKLKMSLKKEMSRPEVTLHLQGAGQEREWYITNCTHSYPLYRYGLGLEVMLSDRSTILLLMFNMDDIAFEIHPKGYLLAAAKSSSLQHTSGNLILPSGECTRFDLSEMESGTFLFSCAGLPNDYFPKSIKIFSKT